MSTREKPNAKRHDEAIFKQTRPEVTLLAILAVFMVLLFRAVRGAYSVVHGPATAFRATQSARIIPASRLRKQSGAASILVLAPQHAHV